MREPTACTEAILRTATGLLDASASTIDRRGLTLIGVALANVADEGAVQLALPFNRARQLDTALDMVRNRFGTNAIIRGALVGRDPGQWVPLLPD